MAWLCNTLQYRAKSDQLIFMNKSRYEKNLKETYKTIKNIIVIWYSNARLNPHGYLLLCKNLKWCDNKRTGGKAVKANCVLQANRMQKPL